MRTTKTIRIPAPENLPFINQLFVDSAKKIEDDRQGMDADVWPGMVGEDLISTMKALSPAIYHSLFEVLKPTVYEKLILTPKDLEDVTVEKSASLRHIYLEDGDFEYFSHEQLKIWLLYSAKYPKDIDWRKVATLYNNSPDDQCKAVDSFFWEFRRLGIESLMSQKGLDLPVPESLLPNKTRSVDGDDQVFCEIAQEWMPDDKFHTQFSVTYTDGLANAVTIIGYAGTCEQAIAKATAFTRSNDGPIDVKTQIQKDGTRKVVSPIAGKRVAGTVSISFGDVRVASADLERSVEVEADQYASAGCKLAWGERNAGPLSEQQFRRALWSVEKLIGVRWSKVHHLENDLGM